MSERRLINFYRPRIQVPVSTMNTSPGDWMLYCLPVDFAEALARIAPYLLRQVTYVGQYVSDKQFLGPTESEMEAITDLVEQGMVAIMSGCGIDELTAQLAALTAIQEAMMECVCQMTTWQQQQASQLPDLGGYVDVGNVTYENESDAQASYTPPGTDEERCEYAQAFYWYTYTMFAEKILPAANGTADAITGAIVAASTFGAIATFIGIPVAVLTVIVTAVIAWAIDGAISEFLNWLYASKDEMICILYNALPDLGMAAADLRSYIDAAAEPSFLDKAVLKSVMCSTWHMGFVIADQQENGTWDTYIEAGACDDCEPIPPGCLEINECVLGDWTGGTVDCSSGIATIKGGLSYWNKQSMTPPDNSYLVVRWLPYSGGAYPTADVHFGLTRVSDLAHFNIIQGDPEPVDVPVTVWAPVPSALWGVPCYVDMQQQGYWGGIIYWCLVDEEPT